MHLLLCLLLAAAPSQAQAGPGPGATSAAARSVSINGTTIPAATLAQWAAQGVSVPDGAYWYDRLSGLWGLQGGPAQGLIQAGLDLGGALAANASGGGTGVFFNGRELHPTDHQGLNALVGMVVQPGRYWLDAYGNTGLEGGPALTNLWALWQARYGRAAQGGTWSWSGGTAGAIEGSAFVCTGAGDCSSWSP